MDTLDNHSLYLDNLSAKAKEHDTHTGYSNGGPSDGVRQIPLDVAKPFIERWHYSRGIPTGKNVFFGWYLLGALYAVADYGIGVNGNLARYLARVTEKPVTRSNLFELKRLCRIDPQNTACPLTKVLSRCHKFLKREHGIRFIVSFSDPEHNQFLIQKDVPYNSGGLYKAANFEYLGKTNAEWHVMDEQGDRRHRKFAYRFMQRQCAKGNPITIAEARTTLGLTRVQTEPKDRWFLDLGRYGRDGSMLSPDREQVDRFGGSPRGDAADRMGSSLRVEAGDRAAVAT